MTTTTLQYQAYVSNAGHRPNADINAAEHIRRESLAILAKAGNPMGVPPSALAGQ